MADPAAPTAPTRSRLQQTLIALGVMLVVGLLFFFIGLLQGGKPVPALEQRAEQAETRLALAQDRARLQEALALTYRAALDLDDRNFGTANAHLRTAGAVLESVGVGGSSLDALREAMRATNVEVAQDLEDQRARVLGLAAQIEALMPEAEMPAPSAEPAE